jgi:endoglucanase
MFKKGIGNRKGLFIAIAALLLLALGSSAFAYNYAEALQKSLFFYECQQSGTLPAWNRVEWRGDSCLKDSVTGGWYDAGDHVKFGLPMAAATGMLLWSAYEYKSAIQNSGQWDIYSNNLQFVLDYMVRCHQGSSLVYQVGDGSADHAYWGPVEVIEEIMTRPSYTCNASCVLADTAAALTIGYLVFGNATYLTHAKSLFATADSVQSDASYTAANGFYQSFSGFWDELMWAATWLYIATNDASYLTKAESYIPNLKKQGYAATDPTEYKWTQSWDDKHYGSMLLLARKTGKPEYQAFMEMYLDFWTVGYNSEKIKYTPSGLAWLDTWGSIRYACNTAFLAFVYSDWITDAAKKTRYTSFAESQINFALGTNGRNSSYVVGFGTNPPQHPHHRNAHSSYCGMINDPTTHKHILYGALVGGPDSGDMYTDAIDNYTCNEVACDYNAGYTGCLVKMVALRGGTPLANFPVAETKEPEIFAQACYNSGYGTYTEIRLSMVNKSAWPPRISDKLSARYYIDLTEVFASGLTLSNVYTKMSSTDAKISGLTLVSGNVYYATIDFTGTKIYPGNMNTYHKDIQFQVGLSTGTPDNWSTTNDYSYTGLTSGTFATTAYIPVYDNGVLVFGNEYGGNGTPQPTAIPTTAPTDGPTAIPTIAPTPAPTGSILLGDVNTSGAVDIVDALLVAQYYVGLNPANFNSGAGDVNCSGGVDIVDALLIAQYYVGLISQFC